MVQRAGKQGIDRRISLLSALEAIAAFPEDSKALAWYQLLSKESLN